MCCGAGSHPHAHTRGVHCGCAPDAGCTSTDSNLHAICYWLLQAKEQRHSSVCVCCLCVLFLCVVCVYCLCVLFYVLCEPVCLSCCNSH